MTEALITFGAGTVGFLSPCVLPLLPGYVGFMTGSAVGEKVPMRRALPGTLAFVGGLTFVFISLGASASVLSGFLNDHKRGLELWSGSFVIALGLLMLFIDRIPFLLRERRFQLKPGGGAATSDGLAQGVGLLFAYSLGIGLPFILAGLGLVSFGGRLKRHARTIQMVGGAIMVFIGVLIVTGRLTQLTIWMQKAMTNIGLDIWNF